jgi:HSP20 family protein
MTTATKEKKQVRAENVKENLAQKQTHDTGVVDEVSKPIAHRRVVVPQYEVLKSEQGFEILAKMPGVRQKNLEIQLADRLLSVKGVTDSLEIEGYERVYHEFTAVDYEAGFKLSRDIDGDGISASLEHGVLRLTLPKAKASMPKSITVNAS